MILSLKLLLTPLLIALVTFAGKRWGPFVSGLLMGLPLTSAPVSAILTAQFGSQFASHAAVGSLCGQVSVCVFCLVYSHAAQKLQWPGSTAIALAAFAASTLILNQFKWVLPAASVLLGAIIILVLRFIPQYSAEPVKAAQPYWDIPVRMGLATAFVFLLTSTANSLGPQLSGLISPLPIFGCVMAAFTHKQQGPGSAARLLRGIVAGSWAYAIFFVMVGSLITWLNPFWVYGLAVSAALAVSSGFLIHAGGTRSIQKGNY